MGSTLAPLVLQAVPVGTVLVLKKLFPHWLRQSHPGDPGYSPSNHDRTGGHLVFAETGALVTGTDQLAAWR